MNGKPKTALAFLAGSLAALLAVALVFPALMLHEAASPLSVDETVARIRENAAKTGWTVTKEYDFQASIKEKTGADVGPVKVVEMCQPGYAAGLLSSDGNKKVAVMMPCAVAVYRVADGGTRVASMNVGLMGRLFGGEIARVMALVAADDRAILACVGARP